MLVFSPHHLPQIFDALIVDYRPSYRDITPASTLYMLTRFACLTCDQEWLEELVDGATHEIEETLFVSEPSWCRVLIPTNRPLAASRQHNITRFLAP